MKTIRLAIIFSIAMAPLFVLAQDIDEPVEPTKPLETEAPALNTTQAERVTRLAEASGETEENILRMRQGLAPLDPDADPAADSDVDEPAKTEPKGHGWGLIAKILGLHPGVNGKGTGDKFYPKDEEPNSEGEEGTLLSVRERARDRKLHREDRRAADKPDKLAKEDRSTARAEKKNAHKERVKREKPSKSSRGKKK